MSSSSSKNRRRPAWATWPLPVDTTSPWAPTAIFADPGTITGSIGVVGGKFALIVCTTKSVSRTDVISRGKNSGVLSTNGFSDNERDAMQRLLKRYLRSVHGQGGLGRKMKKDKLEKAGRDGSIRQRGSQDRLVDELGSLDDAIALCQSAKPASVPTTSSKKLILPRPRARSSRCWAPLDPNADSKICRFGRAEFSAWNFA